MSYEEITENDVFTIVVEFPDDEYLMWQLGLTEDVGSEDGIYFEYNSQINGGFDIVRECTVSKGGMHLVLNDNKMLHFYFSKQFNSFSRLKQGLEKIYANELSVLEFQF